MSFLEMAKIVALACGILGIGTTRKKYGTEVNISAFSFWHCKIASCLTTIRCLESVLLASKEQFPMPIPSIIQLLLVDCSFGIDNSDHK